MGGGGGGATTSISYSAKVCILFQIFEVFPSCELRHFINFAFLSSTALHQEKVIINNHSVNIHINGVPNRLESGLLIRFMHLMISTIFNVSEKKAIS